MKKSLSLTLATAMVFSTFSSVAFAAEASMDAQAKFDALKKEGIFEGYSDGTAGLEKEMTRAEYAAVLVRMMNLDKVSSASSYTDVADHWGHQQGYIEAVTKAKYMEGPATGKFDPDGKVTKEQLATIMVRVLNLQVDANAEVEGTVSDWATGYVAAAVKAGLIANDTDFTVNATREVLVNSTYVANEQKPSVNGKVGISEAKATGAAQITVKLTGAVDTSAAKVAVKLGSKEVALKETKWADDKRSVDLVFDKKFTANTYEVVLSGVSNLDDARAVAEVKTEDEKVTKIDFVTASDTLPMAKEVRVDFKVMNQYGEDAGKKASDLDIRVGGRVSWNPISGESAVKLDIDRDNKDIRRDDRIDISITDDDSRVSVNKFFTIGDEQRVSKIELGKLLNLSGKEITSVDKGETAYLQVVAHDQYGFRVVDPVILGDIRLSSRDIDPEKLNGDERNAFSSDTDVDQDGIPEMKIFVTNDADAGDNTVTLYSAGSSVSKIVVVGAPSEPASIEFGVASLSLAEGDGTLWGSSESNSVLYTRYLPLVMKDENGKVLTKDEIVAADARRDIRITDTGSVRAIEIVKSGAFKGQILLDVRREGTGSVTVSLDKKPEVKATINGRVGKERVVDDIAMTSNNGDKGIQIGATTAEAKFKFKTFDQYNDEARDNAYSSKYIAQIEYRGTAAGGDLSIPVRYSTTADNAKAGTTVAKGTKGISTVADSVYVGLGDLFDQEFKIQNGTPGSTYTVKAKLLKLNDENKWVEVDAVTKTYEVLSAADAASKNLTWTAAFDKAVVDGDRTVLMATNKYAAFKDEATADLANNFPKAGKEVKITAKDGSTTILVPENIAKDVVSSNVNFADGAVATNGKAFVFGQDKGEASVTVRFATNKPNVFQTASLKVITKEDATNISKFAPKKVTVVKNRADVVGNNIYDVAILDELVATESTYGNTFSKDNFATYAPMLGINYVVVEVQDSNDSLTIAPNGAITAGNLVTNGNGGSFTIKVSAPSGVEQLVELGVNE